MYRYFLVLDLTVRRLDLNTKIEQDKLWPRLSFVFKCILA